MRNPFKHPFINIPRMSSKSEPMRQLFEANDRSLIFIISSLLLFRHPNSFPHCQFIVARPIVPFSLPYPPLSLFPLTYVSIVPRCFGGGAFRTISLKICRRNSTTWCDCGMKLAKLKSWQITCHMTPILSR